MRTARVLVTPKPVINDPQGATVKQALNSLGFAGVEEVRIGKYLEIQLQASSDAEARSEVEQMCRKLLANRVIEDFRFDVDPAAEADDAGEAVADAAAAGDANADKGPKAAKGARGGSGEG
ncbi:MAG: phosphoribosylformylglycinamidine synthase subunit PurS [Candidatus Dormibacter sp.]|uniref:phosphoribosylformylglycinamidine synthase subunit PurS n=1 Tax=Candidatus Dormibacter sp. TaxID=2973982 RepID=UPI000DAFE488|nr:MAG: hypothetical protein DLM66_02945 [Candidatus Dormibacteraeota bacterium]